MPGRRGPRATGTVALSLVAAVVVALALLISEGATFGPGRILGAVVVGAWCACAVFVAVHRPQELLGLVMAFGALLGAAALFGAALSVRDAATLDAQHWGAAIRAIAVALLPAVGLHLALGLPDGALRSTPRRVAAALGYAASVVLAAYLLDQRPDVPLAPIGATVGAMAVVAFIGYVARCRGAHSAHERARLQWVAWAVVVAAAIAVVAVVLHALVSWPEPVRGVAVATTVLIPLSLALGASERIAVRIDRLLVHTITLAGLAAMVAACYLLIVLGLGRAPTGDEKTLLGLSMLGRGRGAAVDPGARATHRRRDAARLRRTPRARRSAANVREPPHARAAARRAVAPARGIVEEDDVARGRRGVDARHRWPRARSRCPSGEQGGSRSAQQRSR